MTASYCNYQVQADTCTAATNIHNWYQTPPCNTGSSQTFGTQPTYYNGPVRIQTYQNTYTTAANTTTQLWFHDQQTQVLNWFANHNTGSTWGFDTNSKLYRLRDALMKIFVPVDENLVKELSDDEKKLVKAKEVSEKLLKDWLSPAEYKGFKLQGELAIPSKEEVGCLYIIKRDPHSMVEVHKNGKYSHKLCVVSKNGDMPVGDQLLSKLMLLKLNEAEFKQIAIRHR